MSFHKRIRTKKQADLVVSKAVQLLKYGWVPKAAVQECLSYLKLQTNQAGLKKLIHAVIGAANPKLVRDSGWTAAEPDSETEPEEVWE